MSSRRSNAALEAAGTARKQATAKRNQDTSSDDDSDRVTNVRVKPKPVNRSIASKSQYASYSQRQGRPGMSSSQPSTSSTANRTAPARGKQLRAPTYSDSSSSEEEAQPKASQRSARAVPGPSSQINWTQTGNRSRVQAVSSDESDEAAPQRSQPSQAIRRSAPGSSSQARSQPKGRREMFLMETPSGDSMREALLHYILARQNKSPVFLRKDFIREPLMGIRDMYMDTLKEVKTILQKVFLLQLVGFEKSASTQLDGWDSYILIGKVPFSVLCDPEEVETITLAQKFLVLILEMIFMTGNPMDIDSMWEVMTELEFDEELCPEFSDFEKFLKNEYVSKQYLYLREFTEVRGKRNKATYEWGMRSQYEFSKLRMLKSVAQKFNIQDLKIFSHAYTNAKKQVTEYGSAKEKDELKQMEAAMPAMDESMILENENEYVNSLMQSMLDSPGGEGIIGYGDIGTQGSEILSSSLNPDLETQPMEFGDETEDSDQIDDSD